MDLGLPEIVIVVAVLLLVFGSAKIPALARSVGEAVRELKSGLGSDGTPEAAPARTQVEAAHPRRRRWRTAPTTRSRADGLGILRVSTFLTLVGRVPLTQHRSRPVTARPPGQ